MPHTDFELSDWYRAFLRWLKQPAQTQEIIETLSDSASELYLNSLTARHMRWYGRAYGIENLWARCEWGKTDISYGIAEQRFSDWNKAWYAETTGDRGQIEVKLVYGQYQRSKRIAMAESLRKALARRREGDHEEGRLCQQYFGLVWFYLYTYSDNDWQAAMIEAGSDERWTAFLNAAGLKTPISPPDLSPEYGHFFAAGARDLSHVWPIDYSVHGALGVGLWQFDPET